MSTLEPKHESKTVDEIHQEQRAAKKQHGKSPDSKRQAEKNALGAVSTTYQSFLETTASPETIAAYSDYVYDYFLYIKSLPKYSETVKGFDDLIFDPKTGQKRSSDEVTQMCLSFLLNVKSRNIRRATYLVRLWGLKFYYEKANAVSAAWSFLYGKAPSDLRDLEIRAYTREEMAQMIDIDRDPRSVAMLLFMASTTARKGAFDITYDKETGQVINEGMRLKHLFKIEDLLPDNVEDYEELRKYEGYLVKIYAGTPSEYYTFTTPEARRAIDKYLEIRRKDGEELGPESFLFREVYDRTRSQTGAKKPAESVTEQALFGHFARLQKKIHMRPDYKAVDSPKPKDKHSTRHLVKAVHGFRMFGYTVYMNAEEENEISPDFRKFLCGHDNGLATIYYDIKQPASVKRMLKQYLKVVADLTIQGTDSLRVQIAKMLKEKDETQNLMREQMSMLNEIYQWKNAQESARRTLDVQNL